MRCCPSVDNLALVDFDKLLRSVISHLTNCDLTDKQWLQDKRLSVKMGGRGVRQVSSLALPAYLAAAASTESLHNTILEAVTSSEDEMFATYLSRWQGIQGAALPPDSSS